MDLFSKKCLDETETGKHQIQEASTNPSSCNENKQQL